MSKVESTLGPRQRMWRNSHKESKRAGKRLATASHLRQQARQRCVQSTKQAVKALKDAKGARAVVVAAGGAGGNAAAAGLGGGGSSSFYSLSIQGRVWAEVNRNSCICCSTKRKRKIKKRRMVFFCAACFTYQL